eukprot:scaffold802_cov39-Cyclotella_meneghiniana.AAC.1
MYCSDNVLWKLIHFPVPEVSNVTIAVVTTNIVDCCGIAQVLENKQRTILFRSIPYVSDRLSEMVDVVSKWDNRLDAEAS